MCQHRPMLGECRVLDLTDGRGAFAGLLLAQMGADVVMVEPLQGSESRLLPPFVGDEPGAERALVHQAFNRGKRSVVVDLHSIEGRSQFQRLVRGADIVLETGGPAERQSAGNLDWAELTNLNPRVIHGVLSPFGSDGPKADWVASDLVVGAAGAQLSITGNADMPPLRTAVPQTWLHASADLAIGVLMALRERRTSGLGQQVDISAQHSWIEAAFHYPLFDSWGADDPVRNGSHVRIGAVGSTFDYPASDGYATLMLLFGAAVGPFTNSFVRWMVEEGGCDPSWGDIDFVTFNPADDIEKFEELKVLIAAFTGTKTMAELDDAAWERRLLLSPVATLSDVLSNPHFAVRGAFDDLEIPGYAELAKLPGRLAASTPLVLATLAAAPKLGADTEMLLAEGPIELPAVEARPRSAPLAGVKVLDLTISFAGPIIGRILAGHGATVIKVESEQRPDLSRTAGLFIGGDTVDHSACFATYNANKLSLGINLRVDGATEVLFDLVKWADVLLCSFSPGALDRMGLDEAKRNELNPALITLSSSLLGQTGPLSGLAGYGNMAAAVCGFFATTGWPGRTPVGPMGAYTDIISPRFAAALIVAALDHRDRTGEAPDFDLGQGESCLHLLSLGMLDAQVNGRSWERMGNVDHFNAPHAVYSAEGDDQWVAIAVRSNEQWQALAETIGADHLSSLTTSQRLERRDELDELVEAWTRVRTADEAMIQLQGRGVGAHTVQNGSHLGNDEQVLGRCWKVIASHERIGELSINGSPVVMSATPASFASAGPTLGENTFEILTDLLGYDGDRVAELAVLGVLE